MITSLKVKQYSKIYLFILAVLFTGLIYVDVNFQHAEAGEKKESFRVMTYNIHHGRGMDGLVDLERIARVIKKEDPDIVLLQEVDVYVKRSGNVETPEILSELTGLDHFAFGKNLDLEEGEYGNASLSKYPIKHHENLQFDKFGPEQRGILVTEIEINQSNYLILNTHLDHRESDDSERLIYIETASNEILKQTGVDAVLFGGDFNDIPGSKMHQKVKKLLNDAWEVSGKQKGLTMPADQPSKRIDYIFYSGNIESTATWVPVTVASDHRPVVSEFLTIDKNE